MQPKRYQELSVTMKILVVSLCMGLPFFFRKLMDRVNLHSSRGVTALSPLRFSPKRFVRFKMIWLRHGRVSVPRKSATWSQVLLCLLKQRRHFESRETAELRIAGECHLVFHPSPSNRDSMHCFTKSFSKSQERNRLHLRIINFACEKGRLTYLLE